MGEPEGRLPSDSISSRSEERCGEVGPVGGRVGVREGGREEMERRRGCAPSYYITHPECERRHCVSLIFHNYF